MMKFDRSINFEINWRTNNRCRHVAIVNNKLSNVQIDRYFFWTHDVNVNKHFDFEIVDDVYVSLNVNYEDFVFEFVFQIQIYIDVIKVEMFAIFNRSYCHRINDLFNDTSNIKTCNHCLSINDIIQSIFKHKFFITSR